MNYILESASPQTSALDRNDDTENSRTLPTDLYCTGIRWLSSNPRPLEEIVREFRNSSVRSATLIKAICERPGCRCAFRDHESLLAFIVTDASMALASWNTWAPAVRQGRFGGYDRMDYSCSPTLKTEKKVDLIVFRQCQGWFEVLNESHQPIPHMTTVEQIRLINPPSPFLVRSDLKCLVAPAYLEAPTLDDLKSRAANKGITTPFLSRLVSLASSSETLANSTSTILPTGTLLHYVDYLPRCQVKRGRKWKEMGLILALDDSRNPQKSMTSTRSDGKQWEKDSTQSHLVYIGTEDGTPSVFPPKFSLSPVARPDNISGVHSLSSILYKFRLPVSVKPVGPCDSTNSAGGAGPSSADLWSKSTAERGIKCGLSAIPDLNFNDRSYLRLEALCRSDLLILSPVNNPERVFLSTPSMLHDHLFLNGTSEDPRYLQLLTEHQAHAAGFLARAHPKEQLNYLIRHMRDVTKVPRDSYVSRTNVTSSRSAFRDPSVAVEHQLTPEEIGKLYDQLDDIYFYIRHGYYPSHNRRPETSLRMDPSRPPTHTPATSNSANDQLMHAELPSNPPPRSGLLKAEELLAASLDAPVRRPSNHNRFATDSPHRGQPKEHGIW